MGKPCSVVCCWCGQDISCGSLVAYFGYGIVTNPQALNHVFSDTNGDGKLDKDDTLLGEMKELDGGVYQMSELRYGKYLVKETKAPTGFVLDENVYSVSVEENGKTYTVENKAGVGFINAAQKGSLKIVKTSSDGKRRITRYLIWTLLRRWL